MLGQQRQIFYRDGRILNIKEEFVHILYRLTWYSTEYDVNREVNNGRGAVDYKISMGSKDSSLVEFKLAKNSQLKTNLQKQVEIYKEANDTKKAIKVIFFFNDQELEKINGIKRSLGEQDFIDIVLIDCRLENKPSASKA